MRWIIRVGGMVQGVGFRPFAFRLASEAGLSGTVCNTGAGVEIMLDADVNEREDFLARLKAELPPLARIDRISVEAGAAESSFDGFKILQSAGGQVSAAVVADARICSACEAEIVNPAERRFNHAFANCTHCGPRLSIIRKIPYDRANTAMAEFPMCAACRAEYENPGDRRFHAEPIACAACGPKLWIETASGRADLAGGSEIAWLAGEIHAGKIVALKGLGGFHIACLAGSEAAVVKLRAAKQRPHKPFALMALDLAMARQMAEIGPEEAALLASSAGPAVLLRRRDALLSAPSAAPGQSRIAIMLPTTPLHLLLMRAVAAPLIMTSANEGGQPQIISNDAARAQLFAVVDAILMHDRAIENRVDDSVLRLDKAGPAILRRARGYAPAPLLLPDCLHGGKTVFAAGADLKSAFCLASEEGAILSQHLGELDEPDTWAGYEASVALYLGLFQARPDLVAIDTHPAYRSAALGRRMAAEFGADIAAVQHHHAHLAACMAENGADNAPTLGVILDGAGHGADGTVWGGEFLIGNYAGFRRAAHFLPVALPGGDKAAREPWRNAFAHLTAALGADFSEGEFREAEALVRLRQKPLAVLGKMLERGLNSPLASSAGRLFDAFAAVSGVCFERTSYEGQSGMELESLAAPCMSADEAYPVPLPEDGAVLRWDALWREALADSVRGADPAMMAARFHLALIEAVSALAARLARQNGLSRIALSGGVFQNGLLLDGVFARLHAAGFEVLAHHKTPANDGGLALGQAAIALAQRG